MSVRINERLNVSGVKSGLLERIGLLWKIAIPSIALLIIGLLIYNYGLIKDDGQNISAENNNEIIIIDEQTKNSAEKNNTQSGQDQNLTVEKSQDQKQQTVVTENKQSNVVKHKKNKSQSF